MNAWCEVLGISVPSLAAVRGHREANTYALVIVALLERGAPMTLEAIAQELAAAQIFPTAKEALASVKRSRPARVPIYRDGELYSLDPYDQELDLWAFRLGLRPPRVAPKPPEPPPVRGTGPLRIEELDRAWRDASLQQWSMQRLALAVLDAHGEPMLPAAVIAFVTERTKEHKLTNGDAFGRKSSAIAIGDDGRWSIRGERELLLARDAVRSLLEVRARYPRSSPAELAASRESWERRRAAHAEKLAELRRVIVVPYPSAQPRLLTFLDIAERRVWTTSELALPDGYDVIAGEQIRTLLRALGIDPGARRLAELGPPRKTAGPLKLTTAMFVRGTSGLRMIEEAKLARSSEAKLVAALEGNAKALFALHEYGRLHGEVRVSVNRTEYEMVPAPWHHPDEPTLYRMMREAFEMAMGLIAVVGPAPAWEAPWARAERLMVAQPAPYLYVLVDDNGYVVNEHDVQLARFEAVVN